MNTQIQSNLNTEKVAVYATAIGVLFIIVGAFLLFTPKFMTGTMATSLSYDLLAVTILSMGGLLNVLSVRLNNRPRDID